MFMTSKYITFAALLVTAQATDNWWQPVAGTTWAIDLSDTLALPLPNVTAVDGDLFANNGSAWADVKGAGYKLICYFSAGSAENWRPDYSEFQSADIGAPLEGWQGEWWLNTNSANVRAIMGRRMDLAVQNGCDAIDPDNIDAYNNGGGGFNLTSDDATNYVQWLASEGHARGLAVGLKNGGDIIDDVLDDVAFQVNEQCQQYSECSTSQPFIDANKPVFEIEYKEGTPSQSSVDSICNAASNEFSVLIKHMDLDSWQIACPIKGSTTTTDAAPAAASSPVNTNAAAMNMPVIGFHAAVLTVGVALLF